MNNSFVDCSFIGGGCCNEICSQFAAVVGGCNNKVTSGYTHNSIVGGAQNSISNSAGRSFIGGGQCNQIDSCYSSYHAILGGFRNCIRSEYGYGNNSIVGGVSNVISDYNASCNFIGSGNNNTINGYSAARHSIVGGSTNTINGYTSRSSILGGCGNTVNHSCAFIIGANITTAAACTTFTNNASVGGTLKLPLYTATAVQAGAVALSPIQNNQPSSKDTLASLTVDVSGNVVRGSQEATWTFTLAQLNALSNTKQTLLSAPGAGKIVVVEESNWLMVSNGSNSGTFSSNLVCEIDGISSNAVATQMVTARMTEIAASTFGGLGIYSRDVPELNRVYRSNSAMTIRAPGGTNSFPSRCISIALKIKYRVFDSSTF
jgi:hypothetical protein